MRGLSGYSVHKADFSPTNTSRNYCWPCALFKAFNQRELVKCQYGSRSLSNFTFPCPPISPVSIIRIRHQKTTGTEVVCKFPSICGFPTLVHLSAWPRFGRRAKAHLSYSNGWGWRKILQGLVHFAYSSSIKSIPQAVKFLSGGLTKKGLFPP